MQSCTLSRSMCMPLADPSLADPSHVSLHRMLKQISVVGTMNGEPVNHLYSYINYRPYIAKDGELDVCGIAPRGENCGCTGKKVTFTRGLCSSRQ